MAYGPPTPQGAPVYHLGVDVMQVRLPQRESFLQFVQTFKDQVKFDLVILFFCAY
jgi:hypothetical protein